MFCYRDYYCWFQTRVWHKKWTTCSKYFRAWWIKIEPSTLHLISTLEEALWWKLGGSWYQKLSWRSSNNFAMLCWSEPVMIMLMYQSPWMRQQTDLQKRKQKNLKNMLMKSNNYLHVSLGITKELFLKTISFQICSSSVYFSSWFWNKSRILRTTTEIIEAQWKMIMLYKCAISASKK